MLLNLQHLAVRVSPAWLLCNCSYELADIVSYPRRARSALGVDTVLTLDVCMYVCMYVRALERKRLIGMT